MRAIFVMIVLLASFAVVVLPGPAGACGPIDIVNPITYPLGVGDPVAQSGCPVCVDQDPVLGTHNCQNWFVKVSIRL